MLSIFKNSLEAINNLDICSTNVYEKKICDTLGDDFVHKSAKYFDCVYKDETLLEFKKQSGGQWFDLKKMADLGEPEHKIIIVWFLHKNKKFYDVRINTYKEVIEFLDSNLSDNWKEWARVSPVKAEIKFPISLKDIKNMTTSVF